MKYYVYVQSTRLLMDFDSKKRAEGFIEDMMYVNKMKRSNFILIKGKAV